MPYLEIRDQVGCEVRVAPHGALGIGLNPRLFVITFAFCLPSGSAKSIKRHCLAPAVLWDRKNNGGVVGEPHDFIQTQRRTIMPQSRDLLDYRPRTRGGAGPTQGQHC